MYDMYPEAWTAADDRRRPLSADPDAPQPRRRARKAHSVVPAVIALEWPDPKGDAAAA